MAFIDVFNGDADGICALQQLRLCQPRDSVLITGLKRDINLLSKVDAEQGDEITVLDVSLEKNIEDLQRNLQNGASIFYADHHYPGEIPEHQNLSCHIDVAANTCTSLIINNFLDAAQAKWAVVGAYGDNFDFQASGLADSIGVSSSEQAQLQHLGICLNYNGYGFELDDLLFHPADLYNEVSVFEDPAEFVKSSAFQRLDEQYQQDVQLSTDSIPEEKNDSIALYLLPNASWAKRYVGVMGNELAKQFPQRAHALLIDMGDGSYRVSVRAPYATKSGADDLCRQFESGGGRKAAAGINKLDANLLSEFSEKFQQAFR